MKKLLSLLSAITIVGNGIWGIVGNAPTPEKNEINYSQTNNLENLNRVQRNMCNNSYIEKLTNIESDIRNIAVDSKGNIFFYKSENNTPTYGSYNLYVLKQDKSTPTKINGINGEVYSMVIDNNDNVYIVASDSFYKNDKNLYILKQGTYTVTKIEGINEKFITSLNIYNGDVYIGTTNSNVDIRPIDGYAYIGPKKYNAYILKQGENTPTEINFKPFSAKGTLKNIGITKKGDIYFGINSNSAYEGGIYLLKQGTNEVQKFTQIDRPDITSISIDDNDNVYIGSDYFTYMLKNNGEFTKIYRIQGNRNILIDNKNNVYFINYNNIYLLSKNKIKSLTPTVRKIDTLEGINIWNSFIDKITNKIYFATSEGPYIFKK